MAFSINDAIDVFYFKILLQKFCHKIEKKNILKTVKLDGNVEFAT